PPAPLGGLASCGPLWSPKVSIDIWGPPSPNTSLRDRIARSFSPPLFPLDPKDVPSNAPFHRVPPEPGAVGSGRFLEPRGAGRPPGAEGRLPHRGRWRNVCVHARPGAGTRGRGRQAARLGLRSRGLGRRRPVG